MRPHLHVDAQYGGDLLLRWVFVCHGPTRLARDKAQLLLQGAAIDFVDHPVDVVGQLIARLAHALVVGHQLGCAVGNSHLFGHRKPPALQGLQHGVVRGEVGAALAPPA